ncbi:MAG: hypothetical protein EWV92_03440 [Microcystis aeruginosa Ma_MB_S_20031200_S102]|uniref:Uncharacterized protein n=1 Tax=Microcystis aeruginosa Ma_MB_S_20031200_S102 TaxID=2486254 RepID=A0A552F3S1_MICAE|nr:MAG: hypothetical protein EWV79_14625 [Microcystis aeruginosa Ma_MB_S_20031200_S102D]TRU41351.1 MAG: hypothetical protein EWV92_03440 [Microcystis aeruginosa Ma_MB_S_20031200_S102]
MTSKSAGLCSNRGGKLGTFSLKIDKTPHPTPHTLHPTPYLKTLRDSKTSVLIKIPTKPIAIVG